MLCARAGGARGLETSVHMSASHAATSLTSLPRKLLPDEKGGGGVGRGEGGEGGGKGGGTDGGEGG